MKIKWFIDYLDPYIAQSYNCFRLHWSDISGGYEEMDCMLLILQCLILNKGYQEDLNIVFGVYMPLSADNEVLSCWFSKYDYLIKNFILKDQKLYLTISRKSGLFRCK